MHLPAIAPGLLILAMSSAAAGAQTPQMHADARLPSARQWELDLHPSWLRFDALHGVGGTSGATPLGTQFSGNLDRTNLPLLGGTETALSVLTGQPSLSLTAGQLSVGANSRVASVPISLRYGLSRRIALRLTVPLVETRATVVPRLNETPSSPPPDGLVGPNPAAFFGNTAATTQNAAVDQALRLAITQLAARVAACQSNPGNPGCADVNARRAEAQALGTSALTFAEAAAGLYGVGDEKPGQAFVPIRESALQNAVDARLAALRTAFGSFGVAAGAGSFAAAGGPAALNQLQRLVNDARFGIGRDSIGRTTRMGVGDIEVGAAMQLFDSFSDTLATGTERRMMIEAVLRLPTGQQALTNRAFDIGPGDGQLDVDGQAILDVMRGTRWMGTITGAVSLPLTSAEVARLPGVNGSLLPLAAATPGSWKTGPSLSATVSPRFALTRYLRLVGHYAVVHQGADEVNASAGAAVRGRAAATEQRAGLGLSYSAVGSGGGEALPMEMTIAHVRTLTASGGPLPRASWQRVGVRWYF